MRTYLVLGFAGCLAVGILIGYAIVPPHEPDSGLVWPTYSDPPVTDRQQLREQIEAIERCDRALRQPPPETLREMQSDIERPSPARQPCAVLRHITI
jgi:hypothetical protein